MLSLVNIKDSVIESGGGELGVVMAAGEAEGRVAAVIGAVGAGEGVGDVGECAAGEGLVAVGESDDVLG